MIDFWDSVRGTQIGEAQTFVDSFNGSPETSITKEPVGSTADSGRWFYGHRSTTDKVGFLGGAAGHGNQIYSSVNGSTDCTITIPDGLIFVTINI